MPFYSYKCNDCGETFDLLRKYEHREAKTICVHCAKDNVKYTPAYKFNATGLPNGFSSTRSKSRGE